MRFLPLTVLTLAIIAAKSVDAAPVDYTRQLKPLFHEKCNACHSALKQKSGLRTDAVQLLRKGGDGGAAIVPGKPDESLLVHAVEGSHDMEKMPLEGAALSADQIKLLRDWIAQGAKAADEPIPPSPADHWAFKPPVRPQVPSLPPTVGGIRNPIDAFVAADRHSHGLSPLGEAPKHLLLRRVYLDLVGVPPTPAEMQAFLADESADAYEKVVDRLLADPRHGQRWGRHWMDVWRYSDWAGYGKQVRESRPGIWRWRDWIIESLNADRPYDEMVRLMIAADEMVGTAALEAAAPAAAALGTPTSTSAVSSPSAATAGGDAGVPKHGVPALSDLRAGGYLARSWFKFNKNVWMDNTVEHFGKAFLGLTLNCARCHDHKYDPIDQTEYYQLRAFFEPIEIRSDPVPGLPDPELDGIAIVYDKDPAAPTFLLRRGDEKQPVKDRVIPAATPAIFGTPVAIKPVDVSPAMRYPGLRDDVRQEVLAKAEKALETAQAEASQSVEKGGDATELAKAKLAAAEAELTAVKARLAADAATYRTKNSSDNAKPIAKDLAIAAEIAERSAAVARAEATLVAAKQAIAAAPAGQPADGKAQDAKAKKAAEDRAKALAAAEKAHKDAIAAAAKPATGKYTPLTPVYAETSTGRRTALAAWVTSRQNPLAARVAINHIWMRHVGSPIVATEFDFGLNGKPPTNPALLDWLAVEFMERGWSMKRIHRLIVTSATYRLSSGDADDTSANASGRYAANSRIDPDNVRLWRANVRRMDAEVVRDSLLAVAGKLDTSLGGEELDQNAWQSSVRRSLYYRHAHEKQGTFAMVFDSASPVECYRRIETITPQQSLALANSPLAVSHARLLAAELSKQPPSADGASSFIRSAFARVLNRPPTSDELEACSAFIETQSKLLANAKALSPHDGIEKASVPPAADPVQRARENLVHVLLNHNDFVTIR